MNVTKARNAVYQYGVLWERKLFAYLFQEGSLEDLHRAILCYKNADHGYGHALEHDIRYPGSHPLALEYLLRVLQDTQTPIGSLLDGAADWVEANQNEDGSMQNPPQLYEYPRAPWWQETGQDAPDSIVGNLISFGKANEVIITRTRKWVQGNLTIEAIQQQEWLFMLYHAYDYFNADGDFPQVAIYRQATIDRIRELAQGLPEEQLGSLFLFAPRPDSAVARAMPQIIEKALNVIEKQQHEDGSWHDQHNLPQWYAMNTINMLLTLKRYGRS